MDIVPSSYVVPRQKRGQETLERILDAAEEEIRTSGVDALRVTNVVHRAGVSVGGFYHRFPDKSALLYAVQDRYHNRLEPVIMAELAAGADRCTTLQEAAEYAFDVLGGRLSADEALVYAFFKLSASDPVINRRYARVLQGRRAALSSVLLKHRAEIRHSDPKLAIDTAYSIFSGVLRDVIFLGDQYESCYGVGGSIFRDVTRALVCYLRCDYAKKG